MTKPGYERVVEPALEHRTKKKRRSTPPTAEVSAGIGSIEFSKRERSGQMHTAANRGEPDLKEDEFDIMPNVSNS